MRIRRVLAIAVTALSSAVLAAPAHAFDFPVQNINDSGNGSLREAILDANATSGADRIVFDIAGTAVHKIAPTSALPAIDDAVVIDGYTQPGASANTLAGGNNAVFKIELSGENTATGTSGLVFATGSLQSTVRGLVVNRFPAVQIRLGGGLGRVEGSFIGTDPTGTLDPGGEATGVLVESNQNGVGGIEPAERNLISGIDGDGVFVAGPSADTFVAGNYIGTTRSGNAALPNDDNGVEAEDAPDTTIGGFPGVGRIVNVISGNRGDGVQITDSPRSVVTASHIGTNAAGTAALGNAVNGVAIRGADNFVGSPSARNVISGNGFFGVRVDSGAASVVRANHIGLDAAGSASLPNVLGGMIVTGPSDLTVGGDEAAERNVISGNGGNGVDVSGSGVQVQRNHIGTNAAGTAARPNAGAGVLLRGDGNTVGGISSGTRNVISGNAFAGVHAEFPAAHDNRIVGNHIGVASTGTAAVPNGSHGVHVANAPDTVIGAASLTPGGASNVISGNHGSGVFVTGSLATGTRIDGNLLGTDAPGGAALPNRDDGVSIVDGATASLGSAAGNVISGNELSGVFIAGRGTEGTVLFDNVVGLNRTGTGAVPNGNGVEIAGGATSNTVGFQLDGARRNVISGNRLAGVLIRGTGTTGNTVMESFVGLNTAGSSAIPNGRGVVVSDGAQRNTVGGEPLAARNVISGNRSEGVLFTGAGTDRNLMLGDFVGTTASGTVALPNLVGVNVGAGARGNTVAESLVSGNTTAGVRVADAATRSTRVQGNLIGTGPGGNGPLPNGSGVVVTAGAQATTIGGAGGLGNRIGFNAAAGVRVEGSSTTGAEVTRNAIFKNGGLGINLRAAGEGADVPTPNDLDDPDTGPNALQNFPVITAANGSAGATTISGTLNSRPSVTYRVEVFRNPASPDVEADTFVGAATVTTSAGGDGTWSLSIPADLSGRVLRATATRLDTSSTSELSATRTVG